MATRKGKVELHDFSQPWKFSDVVLVVEEGRLHVHRAVLALYSPVFDKMFTSEFQEKDKNEIPLPGKSSTEVKELLSVIYPPSSNEITEENCHFLAKLAHEYQMDAVVQRCQNFLVRKVKSTLTPKDRVLEELVFAQKYNLNVLRKAAVDQAQHFSLKELKGSDMYDQIETENVIEIMEGIISRLQSLLSSPKSVQNWNTRERDVWDY